VRSRLRKKRRKDLYRRQFGGIVGWVLTLDKKLRDELLASKPGTPFLITSEMAIAEGRPAACTPAGLRGFVAVARPLPDGLHNWELVCWSQEWPKVRETLFLADPGPVYVDGEWKRMDLFASR